MTRMAIAKSVARAAIIGVEDDAEAVVSPEEVVDDKKVVGEEGVGLPLIRLPLLGEVDNRVGVENGVVEGKAKRERVEVGVGVEEGVGVEVRDGTTTVTGWGSTAATRLSAESYPMELAIPEAATACSKLPSVIKALFWVLTVSSDRR